MKFLFRLETANLHPPQLNSIISTFNSLSRADGEELGNDLEWHAFGFRDFQVDENPWNYTHDCVDAKDTSKTYCTKHHRQRIGYDYIANPEYHCTYGNAEATHPCRENLRAKDVWNWTICHHKDAEVNNYAYGRDCCIDDRAHCNKLKHDEN